MTTARLILYFLMQHLTHSKVFREAGQLFSGVNKNQATATALLVQGCVPRIPRSCTGSLGGERREAGVEERRRCSGLPLETTSSALAARAQPSRGEGGNIEPQTEETAKARQQALPHAASPRGAGRHAEHRLPAFCTIWSQLASANEAREQEAKGNKSVPPQQCTGLPAAQRSLQQDLARTGKALPASPGHALVRASLHAQPSPP